MAIFGNATVYNDDGTVIITLLGTKTDVYLNYIVGVLILIFFIVSTLLNPVVFIYKYNQPRSAASLLYMMLSASDFLTTLLRPFLLSYELLKPGIDDYISSCTMIKLFRNVYYSLFTELSMTITACLAIMRFIAIQFPFYRPKKKNLIGAIVTWTLFCVISLTAVKILACNNQGENEVRIVWMRSDQSFIIWEPTMILRKVNSLRYMTTTFVSLVASGLTAIAMLKKKKTPHTRSRNRGCITIIVMNTALIIDLVLVMKDSVPQIFHPNSNTVASLNSLKTLMRYDTSATFTFFVIYNGPLILSAFNPMVVVLFSSQIKDFIRSKLRIVRIRIQLNKRGRRTDKVKASKVGQPDLSENNMHCDSVVFVNRTYNSLC